MDWTSKKILITGGTGSFGKAFARYAIDHLNPAVIRIFSRDELKQAQMREAFGNTDKLRFFVGDVRDADRVERALRGVDIVIHAAAMKRIEVCEYNPFEAVKTNIIGTQNVIDKAIDCGVERVLSLSTDKAANPANLYGATKLCQEKITIQSNSYVGPKKTKLACVRYGNVVGSRGSVIHLFKDQAKNGEIKITDERMTRFWITLSQAVRFVDTSIQMMRGGEIFIPKIPSMKIVDLAKTLFPDIPHKVVGLRPGEKLHEAMVTRDEASHCVELDDRYVIAPEFNWWSPSYHSEGKSVSKDFFYSSDTNTHWLDEKSLMQTLKSAGIEF